MQTFLKSPIHSSSRKGFTLVELLISVAIISIVTATVLVRHNSFDSTVLLKSAAYEIALSLREAQIKSLSQVRSGNDQMSFNYPYGMSFTPGSKIYTVFKYASPTQRPYNDSAQSSPLASIINTFTLDRSMQVSDVCVYGTSLSDPCDVDRLDISFRRPEYKALFFADAATDYSTTITSAKIKVNSANNAGGTNVFVIEVTSLGQISVSKQP